MVWWKLGGGASPHASARPHRTLLPSLLTHSSSSSLPPLSGGSLRTSTRTKIGRARITHLQGECSYLQTTRRGGGGDSTSAECLLSINRLPDPTGPVVPAIHQQRGAVTVVFSQPPLFRRRRRRRRRRFHRSSHGHRRCPPSRRHRHRLLWSLPRPALAVVAEGLPSEARAGR